LDEASKVIAGNPRLEADRIGAGLKPIPGDGDPVAGPVPSIEGLYALFTHSGATLGLALGELAAEEIATGTPSPVLEAFRLERFDAEAAADA
ncbi:UNVERIFIED_CONTAM: FAD-binding oxidoreductase, partial [Aeromonas hydrophila]